MQKKGYSVEIPSRNFGTSCKFSEPKFIDGMKLAWKETQEVFGDMEIDFPKENVCIKADWSEIIDEKLKIIDLDIPEFKMHSSKSNISKLYITIITKSSHTQEIQDYLNTYLNYVFISMNLSTPGISRVNLSEYEFLPMNFGEGLFIDAGISSNRFSWPQIKILSLKDVCDWLILNSFLLNDTAKCRTERSLYALLYTCSNRNCDPMNIIWMAYAIESLLSVSSNQILHNIKNRAFKILGEPERNRKIITKEFSNFYNLRSKIAHGDFSIWNPIFTTNIDDSSDDNFDLMQEKMEFASALLISLLQTMIENKWKRINFEEELILKPDFQ